MEALNTRFRILLQRTPTDFLRYLHHEVNWNNRLISIIGARGVGKTTMLLQRIKLHDDPSTTLFITADDLYFSTHTIFDTAMSFYQNGGKRLYIDEIHKYKEWSRELKNIYDLLPDLQVVYTGSSILDLEKEGADLSRRRITYHLEGLSFREYVNIKHGLNLPKYTLDEVISGNVSFPYDTLRPLQLLKEYMREGYYPYFQEGDFLIRLNNVVKQIIEQDIPSFADINIASIAKLRKLLYVLAHSVPFKPNYAKLERDLDISRNTLPNYMTYLESTGLISLLKEKAQGIKKLEKIEKVYLNNTNIAYAITDTMPDIGTLRETLFFSWTRLKHKVTASPISDFEIDGMTFEIGGKNKGTKQIRDADKGYIVKDNIEYAYDNHIPLWMFGMLY